ncbi:hypothetical protein AHAS_Ahas13G0459600 [Arachis hypogaea]
MIGHMDQMQPVGTGLWAHMSRTGGRIQAIHRLHLGGISDSSPKGFHTVCMMVFSSMALLRHQMGKTVGGGLAATTYMIFIIPLPMVPGLSLVVHLTSLRVLSGHLQQYRK